MIDTMIFDLDGTLIQTERLKAQSYAQAAVALCPIALSEDEVIEAFKELVGLSRREVATALVERFNLQEKAGRRQAEFGVSSPWQAFVQVRLAYYHELLADPEVIRLARWPHTMDLLAEARRFCRHVCLATMSRREQVSRILHLLDLADAFDFVATRDDVEHGKPDPEIYELVADEVGVLPAQCLVIEDSPAGVRAALAASMHVIAVATPFTRQALRDQQLVPARWLVNDTALLPAIVATRLAENA